MGSEMCIRDSLGLYEISDAAKLVEESVHPDANIIFGAVIDDSLGDEVRVTVIAAGFDESAEHRKAPVVVHEDEGPAEDGPVAEETWLLPGEEVPPVAEHTPVSARHAADEGELDVPEFLR